MNFIKSWDLIRISLCHVSAFHKDQRKTHYLQKYTFEQRPVEQKLTQRALLSADCVAGGVKIMSSKDLNHFKNISHFPPKHCETFACIV